MMKLSLSRSSTVLEEENPTDSLFLFREFVSGELSDVGGVRTPDLGRVFVLVASEYFAVDMST